MAFEFLNFIRGEKKFNGVVITINKLDNTVDELDKELSPEEVKKSIYKDLLDFSFK